MIRHQNRVYGYQFVDLGLEKEFYLLEKGTDEEKQIFKFVKRAITDLLANPFCGIKVQENRWPKEYIKKYKINNLHKYDLPNGWRLIYTIRGNEVEIISVILEWFSHKEYERRFKY